MQEDVLAVSDRLGPLVFECAIGTSIETGILSEVIEGVMRPTEADAHIMTAIIAG